MAKLKAKTKTVNTKKQNFLLKRKIEEKNRKIKELADRVSAMHKEMQDLCFQLVSTITIAMEMRDGYARKFAEKTSSYGEKIAKAMGLPENRVEMVKRAGHLLEIGRLGLKQDLFSKMEKLTEEEFEEVKAHPKIAFDILKPIKFFEEITPIIHHHHERFDGKGYPDGLKGNKICIESRILALASAYVAMTQERPHRKALTKEEAKKELLNGSSSQFDPEIVRVFLEILEKEN